MRLVSLEANKQSFHPVEFRPEGVSIVLGRKTTSDKKKTYNGVGKSLCLELVHFCLASSKNKALEKAIPDWTFALTVESGGEEYEISRATSKQNAFFVNGKKYTRTKLSDFLMDLCFQKPDADIYGLSFRFLMQQFIRRGKPAYVNEMVFRKNETPYEQQLRAAFLLGLDVSLCDRKRRLKSLLDQWVARQKDLENDEVIRSYFSDGGSDPQIVLQDLTEEIDRLERDIANFNVAEDYRAVQDSADEARKVLQVHRNEIVQTRRAIHSIDSSLRLRSDVTPEDVARVYHEAQVALPTQVVKTLRDVAAFQERLLEKRRRRLSAERLRLQRKLDSLESLVQDLSALLDQRLAYLSSHGALGELVDLTAHVGRLRRRVEKVQQLEELSHQYRRERRRVKAQLLQESVAAEEHLADMGPILQAHMARFRAYSKRFYNEPGGLVFGNNEGENKVRFAIRAHIPDDASDGIGEVKMFCYDKTVLESRHAHSVDFLFHDSRLFANIDPRQQAQIFRTALPDKRQYIASLNENQLEGMVPHLSPSEQTEMQDAVVVSLTDADPSAKLLGIQVDMHYD